MTGPGRGEPGGAYVRELTVMLAGVAEAAARLRAEAERVVSGYSAEM